MTKKNRNMMNCLLFMEKKNVQCTNSEVECKTTAIDQVLQHIKNSFQNVKLIIFLIKLEKTQMVHALKRITIFPNQIYGTELLIF